MAYLAVHKEPRDKGVATQLIDKAIPYCNGNITLNINKENNAIKLFKKKDLPLTKFK